MVTVIGWDEEDFETSGRHECLEGASIEERASFFDRTLEEEAMGIMMTGGSRAEEAKEFAADLASQRGITVDVLVRAQLDLEINHSTSDLQRSWSSAVRDEIERTSAIGGDAILEAMHAARDTAASHWQREAPYLASPAASSASAVPDKIPPLYWDQQCCVCQGEFLQPSATAAEAGEVLPGFLACGHLTCKDCFDAIRQHPQLMNSHGHARCPVCRKFSDYAWQPLVVSEGSGKSAKCTWIVVPTKEEEPGGVELKPEVVPGLYADTKPVVEAPDESGGVGIVRPSPVTRSMSGRSGSSTGSISRSISGSVKGCVCS